MQGGAAVERVDEAVQPSGLVHFAHPRKIEPRARSGHPVGMADNGIPPELRRFILATLPSVPHLEALLLLRDRASGLAIDELAARLYVAQSTAAKLAAELAEVGLAAVADDRAAYRPARDELRAVVDTLAAVYARNVVEVSRLIHSTTDRKAFQFADAFRLRKEGE